jgi:hypothetical protein
MHRLLAVSVLALAVSPEFGGCLAAQEEEAVQYTAKDGGPGGKDFVTPRVPRGGRLVRIQVNAGTYVDGISFSYTDAEGKEYTEKFGGPGGTKQEPYTIPEGVELIGIDGDYGRNIDRIRFLFSDGSKTQYYGGPAGPNNFENRLPKKGGRYVGKTIGFHGRAGKYIDAIGLQYSPR